MGHLQRIAPPGDYRFVNGDVTIQTVHGPEGLAEIQGAWEAVAERMRGARHFFHTFEWYRSYLETIEEHPSSVAFHLASQGGVPQAVLPLHAASRRLCSIPVRVWEIPHHKHMSLSDFICVPGAENEVWLGRMVGHLRASAARDWDVLLLPRVLENSCARRGLARHSPGRVRCEVTDRCDSLAFASYEEFVEAISKNFRGNLRKARNKLAKVPEAKFLFVREPDGLSRAFDLFCQAEASGWKGGQGTGTAIQMDARLRSFYQALVRHFGARGRCEINLLLLGEACVAGQFCLRVDHTLYVLKIGYDEAHAPLAPGNMLLEQLLQRSTSAGAPPERLNLISGVRWHDDWKPTSETVSDIWIYNRTPKATALFWLAAARRWAGAALRRIKSRNGPSARPRDE